ncbi:2-isopropylmalate synthase [Psychrobacter sp. I-STPA10]|uniref:2-isopropylmalate synthase n=1 Tax=Psychrobacter sp. I-STPA10 TaxID=2585769 RepID=UPI001E4323A5|nr:2-isopropylmalate synthase [Psychrobacter sp. I-STPA10]
MLANPATKYKRFDVEPFYQRTWCNKQLMGAPRWCSSDLRDGNQALINPMDMDKKIMLFNHLLEIGFKEIEVAFPSASATDFNFVRHLIDNQKIPEDVWIQVITQSRASLIAKTFEALKDAPRAIVHLYNATAPVFREVVFQQNKAETIQLALQGAQQIRNQCEAQPETLWQFEYSPETFCFTERDFALEICEAVKDVWQPNPQRPMIINLPATVEMNTPNVYADQIEWFIKNFSDLSDITISIHPHNDRGTGVACAELAMLAGATRVEGCLFGNGERTGNVDLVTLALNLYTQGISPKLDFSNLAQTVKTMVHCNELPIHPRHPYAGELVFTAFSGSHQDAIKKGFSKRDANPQQIWNVPYFTIDPKDIGSDYEAVIRVNSQSGKSGATWLLAQHHGLHLPPAFQIDFSQKVKQFTHHNEQEASIADIWTLFRHSYGLLTAQEIQTQATPIVTIGKMQGENIGENTNEEKTKDSYQLTIQLHYDGQTLEIQGSGNGLLSAFIDAINHTFAQNFSIQNFDEHSLGNASNSQAVCYVVLKNNAPENGEMLKNESAKSEELNNEKENDELVKQEQEQEQDRLFGVAIGDDIAKTSVQAVINACQRFLSKAFIDILSI